MAGFSMELDQIELEKRLPVWRALSDLFLDTELNHSDFEYIANRIRKSDYSALEAQTILWNEVFPALGDNLRIGTGEWAYFSDDWLQERILRVLNGTDEASGGYGLITVSQARQVIAENWYKVLTFLQNG